MRHDTPDNSAERPRLADRFPDTQACPSRSALAVLIEVVATVESYGTGGHWLSRASPLIAKARLACFQDRTECLADLENAHPNRQATVLRYCLRELIGRIAAARALLDRDGIGTGSAPQIVAQVSSLRDLLDIASIARVLDRLSLDGGNQVSDEEVKVE